MQEKGSELLFPVQNVTDVIKQIKSGDSLAREEFLKDSKPFIFKAACKISGRFLEWGRDDELAVALIAFNEAIERFREDSGVPFLAFARLVIGSRLTDHHRRENRTLPATVPLSSEDSLNDAGAARAWEIFWEEEAAREREEEIKEFEKLLNTYGITFEDLVKCSPRHSDTRRSLMIAARVLVEKANLFEELKDKKRLPLLDLQAATGIGRKTLERGRKYILAAALLIYRRDDFSHLGSYLNMPARE